MLLNSEWVVLQSLEESNRYTGGISKEIADYYAGTLTKQSRYDLNLDLKHIAIEFDIFGYNFRKDGLKFLSYNLDTKKNEYTDVNYSRGMYVKERMFWNKSVMPQGTTFISPHLRPTYTATHRNVVDILYSAMNRNKIQESLNFKNKWRIWYTIDGKEIPYPLTLTQCFTLVVWDRDKEDWCFKELFDVKVGDKLKGIYDDVEIIVEATEKDRYEIDYVLGTKNWSASSNAQSQFTSYDFDREKPYMICSTNKTMYMRPVPYVDNSYIKFELGKLTTDVQKGQKSNVNYQTVLNNKIVYGYNCPIDKDKDQGDRDNHAGHMSVTSVENAEENYLWGKEFEKMFVCVGMFNSIPIDKYIEAEKTHNILYNAGIGADHKHGDALDENAYTGNIGIIQEGYQKRNVNLLRVITESLILNMSTMSGCEVQDKVANTQFIKNAILSDWLDTKMNYTFYNMIHFTKFNLFDDTMLKADHNGSKLVNIVWSNKTWELGLSCLTLATKLMVWLNTALAFIEDDSDEKINYAEWYEYYNDLSFKGVKDNLNIDNISSLIPQNLVEKAKEVISTMEKDEGMFKFFDEKNRKIQIYEWFETLLKLGTRCAMAIRDDINETDGSYKLFNLTSGTGRQMFDMQNAIDCTISRLVYLNNYFDYVKSIVDKWLGETELKSILGDNGVNHTVTYLNQIRNDLFENSDRWGCFYRPLDLRYCYSGPTKLVRDKIYEYANKRGYQKGITEEIKKVLEDDKWFVYVFIRRESSYAKGDDVDGTFYWRWFDLTEIKKKLNCAPLITGNCLNINKTTSAESARNASYQNFAIRFSMDDLARTNFRYFVKTQEFMVDSSGQARRQEWYFDN